MLVGLGWTTGERCFFNSNARQKSNITGDSVPDKKSIMCKRLVAGLSLRLWRVRKVMCVVTRAMRVMTETQVGGVSLNRAW